MRAHLPFTAEEREWRDEHIFRVQPARLVGAKVANVVDGWDTSSYQPAGINYTTGGRRVAAFKATEGLTYFDGPSGSPGSTFWANRRSAHATEDLLVAIIIYHFARPSTSGGGDQARYMLKKIGPRQNKEVVACDFEVNPWSAQWIIDFLDVIMLAGYPTEFYTFAGMTAANSTAGIPQTGTGYWPASYPNEPSNDRWIGGKDGYQHTDGQASVPGNDGPYDCSHWDAVKLAARVASTPMPGPSPSPTPTPPRVPWEIFENIN